MKDLAGRRGMQRVGAALWPNLQCFQVYGANTNVGKTIVSTILCKSWQENQGLKVRYVKPVSTGSLGEADTKYGYPVLESYFQDN